MSGATPKKCSACSTAFKLKGYAPATGPWAAIRFRLASVGSAIAGLLRDLDALSARHSALRTAAASNQPYHGIGGDALFAAQIPQAFPLLGLYFYPGGGPNPLPGSIGHPGDH